MVGCNGFREKGYKDGRMQDGQDVLISWVFFIKRLECRTNFIFASILIVYRFKINLDLKKNIFFKNYTLQ